MLRLSKNFLLAVLLAGGLQSAWGYALLGPNNETYQVPDIGYNPIRFVYSDLLQSAPKNLGEEYRRNTPVLYYAFDANFLDYFGAAGVSAIQQAIAVLNSVTNVSRYSKDLSEFPLDVTRENLTAEALGLYDMKSMTMSLLLEQLGLANPERYVWVLKNRSHLNGAPACPDGMEYLIIMRNFDPVASAPDQFQPSEYVNSRLYDYDIYEFCNIQGNNPPPPLADAYELGVDAVSHQFQSVAGLNAGAGFYYTGLTRDDVAGLRYLMRTNNMNTESIGPGAEVFTTNQLAQLLYTSNLNSLATIGLTNDAATLQTLFPGLVVADSSVYFQNSWVPTITSYLMNYPYDPAGTPPHLVYATNWTLTVGTYYNHTYANVYTVKRTSSGYATVRVTDPRNYNANTYVTQQYVTVKPAPYAPAGSGVLVTNVTSTTYLTNTPVGEYFLLPAGACDVAIVRPQLTNYVSVTNILWITTNINVSVTGTNVGSGTNASVSVTVNTASLISYATTHAYVIKTISCESNSVALRQGIEHVQFVRRDYDSLLGQFYLPITNNYTLNVITNNTVRKQRVRRVVTQPDIVFSAEDLVPGPAVTPPLWTDWGRNVNFNSANAYQGLAGPGTIETPTRVVYNKVGPAYYNFGPFATNDVLGFGALYSSLDSIRLAIWGSFDGTTNAPIVFPNGTSIEDLENQVLLQITNPALPDGVVGSGYSVAFNLRGGSAPYTWVIEVSPDYGGLPPGLTLNRHTGVISGVPYLPGIFDFVVRVTDGGARSSIWNYSITVYP